VVTTPRDLAGLRDAFASERLACEWVEDRRSIEAVFGSTMLVGGVNLGDGRALYTIARARRPASVLEVGTHVGASTLHFAAALRCTPGACITTVDILDVNDPHTGPWRAKGLPAPPRALVATLQSGVEVDFVRSRADDFMAATDRRFDLIFLDGSHSADDVYLEVAAATRVLNDGGLILLHDFYPGGRRLFANDRPIRGPYEALARIEAENPTVEAIPFGVLPWTTKPGSNATSLALLARHTPEA